MNSTIPNAEFHRNWHKITKKILKQPRMSVAKKLLAYKVFFRPMLIYHWFQGCGNSLKELEVYALRQIFGNCSEESLYERYTDMSITCYLRLQALIWKRATSRRASVTNVRNMLHAACRSSNDSMPYFTKEEQRQRQNYRRRQQRNRRFSNSISNTESSGSSSAN